MTIPFSNFIDIASSVQGASQVPTRNLNGLVITGNPLVPTGEIVTFQSAAGVGQYFGTGSEEYARALFYFGWVSKQGMQPQQLSFWFWNDDAATTDLIYGATPIDTLAEFTGFTAGELKLTMGGVTATITCGSMAEAGSLAAVATIITTAINAHSAGGTPWTSAVCSYNSTTGTFNLVSGEAEADTIAIAAAASNDLAGPLGWLLPGTILSNGTAAQTITANLNQLIGVSNNFGSFCYTAALAVTEANIVLAASWNNSLTPNVQFMFSVNVSVANASAWQALLANLGGTALTLSSPVSGEYPEMAPMMILGASNYNLPAASQNYNFQQFNLTPSVTDQADFNTYTALNINFYGNTQTAGKILSFYQQGVMQGLAAIPNNMTDYANEIWFKDALGAALMNLLLASTEVSANNAGKAAIVANMQPVINLAITNGTIETGSQLTSTQIAVINSLSGIQTAWVQVQNTGYWLGVTFESYVVGNVTEYKAVYTLIYKQENAINMIQGEDILI